MKKRPKVLYYSDELNEDFSGTHIEHKELPENYQYFNDGFWGKIRRFFIYHVIAKPVIFITNRIIRGVKYVNRKCTKPYKKQGCFLYGNHTTMVVDAFSPTYISFPRSADIVVNSDAVNIKGLRTLVKTLGGMPIPLGFRRLPELTAALEESIRRKHWVAIYPEAHIWHYYTGIRDFTSVSFSYPVKLNTPVFCYTLTYQKRKIGKSPKRVCYVDGPFFPDKELPRKQAMQKLRDEFHSTMSARAKNSNCEVIKYIKVDPETLAAEQQKEN